MPQNTLPPASSHAPRYPVRIPIRMTQEERATIGKSACALNRSISRYLVELATTTPASVAGEGKNQKAVLLPEDKARLSFLRALFHRATEKVQAALASERFVGNGGSGSESADKAGVKTSLEETLRLLDAIGQELGRRIA